MANLKLLLTSMLVLFSLYSNSQYNEKGWTNNSGKSAIGQLENVAGQKINRYNTNNSSGYNMNSVISGMIAQSLVKSIFNSSTKNYNAVKEITVQPTYLITTISGEYASVAQKLKIDKYNRLMQAYKFLRDTATLQYTAFNEKKVPTPEEKKAACIKAKKEIMRLTQMKINFEKQLVALEKLGADMETYKNEFEQKKDSALSGYADNILDVLPVDLMKSNADKLIKAGNTMEQKAKAANMLLEAERLGNELSKTKKLNAAANLLMKNTDEKGMKGKDLDQIVLANENFSNTGVLVEELASLGGNKYEGLITEFGKTLQLEGGVLKTFDDIADGGKLSWDIAGKTAQNFIGIAGQFWPFIRIANAAEQLVEKTAYAAYAKYAAHQVTTSLSQNTKAKEYLNNQLKDIAENLKQQEFTINEYKKINPAGCSLE